MKRELPHTDPTFIQMNSVSYVDICQIKTQNLNIEITTKIVTTYTHIVCPSRQL